MSEDNDWDLHPHLKQSIKSLEDASRSDFINSLTIPEWDRPRSDLKHWKGVTDRIQCIIDEYAQKYNWNDETPKPMKVAEADVKEIVTCLQFLKYLIENCELSDFSLNLNNLLNSYNIDIQLATLDLCVLFSNQASDKLDIEKVVKVAEFYPPQDMQENTSFLDIFSPDIPKKWSEINFKYYRELEELKQLNKKKKPKKAKEEKGEKVNNNKTSNNTNTNTNTNNNTNNNNNKHEKDKQKSGKDNKEDFKEGICTVHLSPKIVKKLSLTEIVEKSNIPSKFYFEFCLQINRAKSFVRNGPEILSFRSKLLMMKFYAVSYITRFCDSEFIDSQLSERQPYLLSSIVDIILPENSSKVSSELYYGAMRTISKISRDLDAWPDLVRSLGANMSHGSLFQILKKLQKDVEQGYLKYPLSSIIHFFETVENLIISHSTSVSRLAVGKLLEVFLSFFNLKTSQNRIVSGVISLTTSLLENHDYLLDELIELGGFKLIIETILREVQFSIDHPEYQGGPPKDVYTYGSISFKQSLYIGNLLELVLHLIKSDAGDRLRNLFDSPLLGSFNQIFNNSNIFGPDIVGLTIYCVHHTLHNEPTAFSIFNEAGVIDTILDNYHKFLLPSANIILPISDVLSAICLNKVGIEKLVAKDTIKLFFRIFYDPDIARICSDNDEALQLARNIDDLRKHQPEMRPVINSEMKDLVSNIGDCVNEKFPGVQFYGLKSPFLSATNPTEQEINRRIWEGKYLLYLFNTFITFMIDHDIQPDQSDYSVPFESWMKLVLLPKAPLNFVSRDGHKDRILEWLSVIRTFDSNGLYPHIIDDFVKEIVNRLKSENIQAFLNSNEKLSLDEFKDSTTKTREILQDLNILSSILHVFQQVYLRSNYLFVHHLEFLFQLIGENKSFLDDLFKLYNRCSLDEIEIRSRNPTEVPTSFGSLLNIEYSTAESEKFEQIDMLTKNVLPIRVLTSRLQVYCISIFQSFKYLESHYQSRPTYIRGTIELFQDFAFHFTALCKNCVDIIHKQKLILDIMSILFPSKSNDTVPHKTLMSFIQNGLFNVLRDWAQQSVSILKENHDDDDNLKLLEDISLIMAKVSNEANINFPDPHVIYSIGYENPSHDVRSSMLDQIRAHSIKFINIYLDCYGLSKKPLMNLVKIIENVLKMTLEPATKYIPLMERTVRPPIELVRKLKHLNITNEEWVRFFDHRVNGSEMESQSFNGSLEFMKNKWETVKGPLKQEIEDIRNIKNEYVFTEKEIDTLTERFRNTIMNDLQNLATKAPLVAPAIACTFRYNKKARPLFMENVLASIQNNSKNIDEKNSLIYLFSILAKDSNYDSISQKFVNILIPEIDPNGSDLKWLANALPVMSQCISYKFSLEPESSSYVLSDKVINHSSEISDENSDTLLNKILSMKNITDVKICNEIVKILLVFSQEKTKMEAIRVSPLLKDLIKFGTTFDGELNPIEDVLKFQSHLTILLHKCYESDEIVFNIMSAEVSAYLKEVGDKELSLNGMVSNLVYLARRNNDIFVDVLSSEINIDNFDGITIRDIMSYKVKKAKKDKEEGNTSEDIEMSDKPASDSTKTTGIMSLLLNLLMETAKKDWSTLESTDSFESGYPVSGLNKNAQTIVYLLTSIIELLSSYKQAKLEFLTFTKKSNGDATKPRGTALNFVIHQLINANHFEGKQNAVTKSIAWLAKLTILSLLSTPVLDRINKPNQSKQDPDMAFTCRFFFDVVLKIIKEATDSNVSFKLRTSRYMGVLDLITALLSKSFHAVLGPVFDSESTKYDLFYLAKIFIEKGLPAHISTMISQFDLNMNEISSISNLSLRPLILLGEIKSKYSQQFADEFQGDKEDEDEDIPLSDDEEEAPDLFRNSTLGMYDFDDEYDVEDVTDDEYEFENELDDLIDVDVIDDQNIGDGSNDEDGDDDIEEEEEEEEEEGAEEGEDNDDIEENNLNDEVSMDESLDSGSDIELIGGIDIGNGSFEVFSDSNDEEAYDSNDSLYEFEDEDVSDYSEGELDGWIEQFEDSEPEMGNREASTRRPSERRNSVRTITLPNTIFGNVEVLEEDSEDRSHYENVPHMNDEYQVDEYEYSPLDSMRHMNPSDIYSSFREAISFRPSQADRLMLLLSPKYIKYVDRQFAGSEILIKSACERWNDYHRLFEVDSSFFSITATKIVNRIAADSIKVYQKKKEKELELRKKREEKLKRREEEIKKRKEKAEEERAASTGTSGSSSEPVYVRIGDRDVDISGTDIDPEFFEALPEDMRLEVFTQHIRERRAQASSSNADEIREIDPDFLDVLPDVIRNEILEQEQLARRFQVFSADSEDESDEDDEEDEEENENGEDKSEEKSGDSKIPKSTFFTPILDKNGIAAIVRLLFIPQSMSKRKTIHEALEYICRSKQSRGETMAMLLGVLQEGLESQKAIERTFCQFTCRARASQEKKKKLINQFPLGSTAMIVGYQTIETIHHLLEKSVHLRYYILTEHENYKKEKGFPINDLLNFLDHDSIIGEPFMDILSLVLSISTRPLKVLKSNKSIPFTPPQIPVEVLGKIVKILVSNNCPKTVFTTTISAMQNLSYLEGVERSLTQVLMDETMSLSKNLLTKLNEIIKELKNQKGDENTLFTEVLISDQSKLLRVLTALDYMLEGFEDDSKDDSIEKLTESYKRLTLGTLWDALSDILKALGDDNSDASSALLPLIESLMIVCKQSKLLKEKETKQNDSDSKKINVTRERIENMFFNFTNEHKNVLNKMVKTNPNLLNGPFGILVRNSSILEFDNKANYFYGQLDKNEENEPENTMAITVKRDQVFLDSYRALFFKSGKEFGLSKLEIEFKGEEGVDAGGVTREWFHVLARQMFNPDYALFTPVSSDETTFHPNRTSYVNAEHLSFFKFIGRIIAKAIHDRVFLDCHFSRAVYKRILNKPVSLKDMESLDLEYSKSLTWILENDITDILTEDFSIETDDYGEHKIIDLIPDGRNIPVTEENKQEYVKKVVEYKLQTSVADQMENFLIGFHEVIPQKLVSIFDEQEIELLISGLPDIDVDDWKANTTYVNYSSSSPQVQWFWRAIRSFNVDERARLLQFATGSSKVPLNGFKELPGSNGPTKFQIHRDYGATDRLPQSHTCFNQIILPAYETYEDLRKYLLKAMNESEGFGFA